MNRTETYHTGISQDGYRESVTVILCHKCDNEAEYEVRGIWYCEECYGDHLEDLRQMCYEEEDL